MTTHDTPEAGLERALERTEKSGYPGRAEWAAAILAALDGWTLVPSGLTADWTGDLARAEIARLRVAGDALYDALWSEGIDAGWAARGRAAMDGWRVPAPSEP
jgi:hypothetical protein